MLSTYERSLGRADTLVAAAATLDGVTCSRFENKSTYGGASLLPTSCFSEYLPFGHFDAPRLVHWAEGLTQSFILSVSGSLGC